MQWEALRPVRVRLGFCLRRRPARPKHRRLALAVRAQMVPHDRIVRMRVLADVVQDLDLNAGLPAVRRVGDAISMRVARTENGRAGTVQIVRVANAATADRDVDPKFFANKRMPMNKNLVVVFSMSVAIACGAREHAATTPDNRLFEPTTAPETLNVTISGLENGRIPLRNVFNGFGCSGENQSLPIAWSEAPANTQSFAVIVHDPDAPTGVGFFHWSVVNLPNTATSIGGGAPLPQGAVEGFTDFGANGYGGPCPPPGAPHRYIVTVYALDVATLPVNGTATGALLRFMLREHTLAFGRAIGTYGRE